VNDAYRASTSEVNALLNLVERLNSFYETSYRQMVSKFGKAVTERALSE
jgi:hypothetical protein